MSEQNIERTKLSVRILKTWLCLLVFLGYSYAGPWVVGEEGLNEKDSKSEAPHKPGARVVVEHTEINGKVVFLADQEDSEMAAVGVKIRILSEGTSDVLHETVTDRNGIFTVPALNVGSYLMTVGRLNIRLEVVPGSRVVSSGYTSPKILLVFIPKDLG